ncbi:spore cortex-lytic enzyme [Marinisporobacter balticus]|uniref:Spore cortex-lytic enzyme n=1 Tax=Marinisporobacter balticus TaxID=2018667 RepID=A0A4V2SB92_9FIRM|nr:spore cortex-lytic enzyme [Marinisporobacter balticus]TCO74580.1 spore cortex-lytic enzyme [Marinisporobacter balticus]
MRKVTIITCVTLMISFLIGNIFIDTIYAGSLSWGSRGEEVRVVQTKLKNWGYYTGNIDGAYGKKTYQAIVNFQKKNGLVVDGKVGTQTRKALGMTTKTTTTKYNDLVKRAQQKLKQWGYYYGAVDGIYGSKTYTAVTKFQKKNGLKGDGIIGSNTKKALGISGKTAKEAYTPTSRGVSRNDDISLLAMAIHGEARGEPYVGKVAVGAVILNRVKHPSFPNSIASTIYQPGAFTAVDDGQIYLKPNAESFKAARDCLNGWDPTGGAIYYWNPATSTSRWIWTREVTLKIGKHWFAHE